MGLKTTITSDASAMAPALTEPINVSQTNLTTLPLTANPSTESKIHIISSTILNNNNGQYLCHKPARDLISKGAFQLAFEKHISNGPKKGPKTVLHMDQTNHILNATTPQTTIQEPSPQPPPPSPPPPPTQQSNLTNNNNTMGLQKDYPKETTDMEQMLGELASTSDLDLLQVFKSFDTAPAGDGLCDLANSLLFNDFDVNNMCGVVEDVVVQEQTNQQSPIKENHQTTDAIRQENDKKQIQMQRKCDFLVRRLKKIQLRSMGQQISEEVAGFFEHTHRLVKKKEKPRDPDEIIVTNQPTVEKMKPLTANAVKNFLKRIDNVAAAQKTYASNIGQSQSLTGPPSIHHNKLVTLIPSLDNSTTTKLEQISGQLQTQLKVVEKGIDSDATASSSGGESGDEAVPCNNDVQQHMPIAKRAVWRYQRDRAAIASRWSWLQAQISDIEYRIRQHNELHNQIRKNKGPVQFEEEEQQSQSAESNLNQSINEPHNVNGYRGILPGNSKTVDSENYDLNALTSSSSCRTKPFQRAGFRKRKLLQTVNLHTISKKAARPSTLKCGCQWPLHPCALCTGRQDPTAPRDLPDMMPASERIALLDPGFHPVLSFPQDISQTVNLEGVIRQPDWQNKALRCTTKTALKSVLAAQKAAERQDRSKKLFESGRRKYNKKFAQGLVANKLKKAKNRRVLQGKYAHLLKKKHRKVSGGIHAPSTSGSDTGGHFDSLLMSRSKNASPTATTSYNNRSERGYTDLRRSRNSYDIDNIVIPYSVAASTRVEILPYKEIPTPKWRITANNNHIQEILTTNQLNNTSHNENEIVENSKNICDEASSLSSVGSPTSSTTTITVPSPTSSQQNQQQQPSMTIPSIHSHENSVAEQQLPEDEIEDISDETIIVKHERALQEERRKFQTFLKFPWSTRSRANRRTDSRADESSGANTPDPTSPAPNTPSISGDHESVPSSPANPGTPQTPLDLIEGSQDATELAPPISAPPFYGNNGKKLERRRTISSRVGKDLREDARRSNTPDLKEIIPPYEPIEYPIPDDIFEIMLKMMPAEHKTIMDNVTSEPERVPTPPINEIIPCDLSNQLNQTIHSSVLIGSGSDLLAIGDDDDSDFETAGLEEDPNDPEWVDEKLEKF